MAPCRRRRIVIVLRTIHGIIFISLIFAVRTYSFLYILFVSHHQNGVVGRYTKRNLGNYMDNDFVQAGTKHKSAHTQRQRQRIYLHRTAQVLWKIKRFEGDKMNILWALSRMVYDCCAGCVCAALYLY